MSRINPVNRQTADGQTLEILDGVKAKLGMVPNLIATMAQSPAVANAYLGFSQALGEGTLPAKLREQLALVVGEANSCGYCVSAHTAIGKAVGLQDDTLLAARQGVSSDPKTQEALAFAQKVVRERGHVDDADVDGLRQAGYSEGEIAEIIANVALNLFTNYFNHIAETEIDFPVAPELQEA